MSNVILVWPKIYIFFSSANLENDITTRIKQQSKKLHGKNSRHFSFRFPWFWSQPYTLSVVTEVKQKQCCSILCTRLIQNKSLDLTLRHIIFYRYLALLPVLMANFTYRKFSKKRLLFEATMFFHLQPWRKKSSTLKRTLRKKMDTR